MSPGRRGMSAIVAVVLGAGALTGCGASTAASVAGAGAAHAGGHDSHGAGRRDTVALSVDETRRSAEVVAAGGNDAPYNYGPTVMADAGRTQMWWCSQYGGAGPPGDDVLYATGNSHEGPLTAGDGKTADAVFSGNPGRFDGTHTCDPSVIRVGGTYYLYYTGAAGDHEHNNAIGVATSTDGRNWTRANDGKPVVRPAHDGHRANTYGAGQPSVVYLDGWFYLMFTDTTGRAAADNGAGQFVLRAKDATFTTGVQALGSRGFADVPETATARTNTLVDAFSADLMWIEALDAFAIGHETDGGTAITFWDRDFTVNPYRPVLVPGPWAEGPGLVRQPDGHAPISTRDVCGRVPIDVVRATEAGPGAAPTALRHFGIDLRQINGCNRRDKAFAVLDGVTMPSPTRTMDLVFGGQVVRVERRSVAAELASTVVEDGGGVLERFPVTARLRSAAPGVRAPDGRVGLLLDDGRLWPLRNPNVAALNDSSVRPVSKQEWDSYPAAVTLGR